jgi:glucose-6-phosphate dehydrogenase assembly protein OpcA
MIAHVTRSTTPDSVEPDLAALWREVGRQGPVARAVMSNLVVFRPADAAEAPSADDDPRNDTLDAVVARHPCRLIVLEHRRDASRFQLPSAAWIRIVTFGTEGSRYGVEQIAIRAACADACLPSIVSALVRGDVPTSLWWMDDLSQAAPPAPVVLLGRQLVYDSRDWRDVGRGMSAAASLLSPGRRLDLADLNWRRLTAVRQALTHAGTSHWSPRPDGRAAGPAWLETLARGRVRIGHRQGDAALAWLAAGWLASRLHWTQGVVPAIEQVGQGDAVLTIDIGDGPAALNVALGDGHVVVTSGRSDAAATSLVPGETVAQAAAAELRNLSHDVCLHEAIRAAASLLQ